MGRSQVERNRTHGRPGQKGGRGQAGSSSRKSSSSSSNVHNLGSNAHRYEKDVANDAEIQNQIENEASAIMLDHTSFGNEYGPSHHSVARDYDVQMDDCIVGGMDRCTLDDDHDEIDVAELSQCLENDTQFNYLRFDNQRLTELFRNRFHGVDRDGKMTVAELRVLGHNMSEIVSTQNNIDSTKLGYEQEEKVNVVNNEKGDDQNIEREDNEEENLEDWLDDMIGT